MTSWKVASKASLYSCTTLASCHVSVTGTAWYSTGGMGKHAPGGSLTQRRSVHRAGTLLYSRRPKICV